VKKTDSSTKVNGNRKGGADEEILEKAPQGRKRMWRIGEPLPWVRKKKRYQRNRTNVVRTPCLQVWKKEKRKVRGKLRGGAQFHIEEEGTKGSRSNKTQLTWS